jgi:hypothetical protein
MLHSHATLLNNDFKKNRKINNIDSNNGAINLLKHREI